MKVTLVGHGYIGTSIAAELTAQGIQFEWQHAKHCRPEGTVIINAAGYTGHPNVDACEVEKENCIRGNVIWPRKLEELARGLPIVHITSGCVYTGYEKEWEESDRPNFGFLNGSFYSGCKAMAEMDFRQWKYKPSYLLRVRMPFGPAPHPKNLLTKLEGYAKLVDQLQSVSYVVDVAKAAVHFATHPEIERGIYNCVNPGGVQIADIAQMMGWNKELMSPEEFRQAIVAPRSECLLSTAKMQKVFQMRPAVQAIHECARAYQRAA